MTIWQYFGHLTAIIRLNLIYCSLHMTVSVYEYNCLSFGRTYIFHVQTMCPQCVRVRFACERLGVRIPVATNPVVIAPLKMMVMRAEHRSKFAALPRKCSRLKKSEKFSSGTKNCKQTMWSRRSHSRLERSPRTPNFMVGCSSHKNG